MTRNLEQLNRLINIVEKLRAPDGCPWDREQTHKSLKENFLQETYEAVDAIDEGNPEDLKEELGDVLLQVVLHSQIASESKKFDIEDVAKIIADKIVRRHPHVFGDIKVKNVDDVMKNWEEIKKEEKPERQSALSGVTKSQPALMMAQQISKKAIKVGFEWPSVQSLFKCLQSEIEEFKDEVRDNNQEKMEEELGDILFSVVNVARWHGLDAELALLKANKKFIRRFQMMENIADKDLTEYSQDELEDLWQQSKQLLK